MARDRVDEAFASVPRERFLPRGEQRFARLDRPLPIGHGQTNSQPTTVRDLLRLLEVRQGDRVLDVGCGSGWTTALLGRLVGARGEVVGVEIVPELATWGRANVEALGMPWTRVELADPDVLGAPEDGPFDRVLVSAEAHEVPHALVEQLAEDGVMVVPVAGRLAVVRRPRPDAEPEVTLVGHYAFVPLLEPGSSAEQGDVAGQ